MVTKIWSAALAGVHAQLVSVEAEIAQGMSLFHIVGLPDTSVQEARERVRSAIKQSGLAFPYNFRITVNLAPADVRKEGAAFDVPIALAILCKTLAIAAPHDAIFLGELGLDGGVRSVRGVLSALHAAVAAGLTRAFVPAHNAREAALMHDIEIFSVQSLAEIVAHLEEKKKIAPFKVSNEKNNVAPFFSKNTSASDTAPPIDFTEIAGNDFAKRALEISAVGDHHILFNGPPGAGKTMLARALIGILPPLDENEIIEVTKIYSAAGLVPSEKLPVTARPFRAPHHSASPIALVGGGRPVKPGDLTLAHRGILFLDEFPEFARDAIEQLRQPLEEGSVRVARADYTAQFPARFILVAAKNPCPCGFATDPSHVCVCTPFERARYNKKISGPLLDRIDLFCEVGRVALDELVATPRAPRETSTQVRERVSRARTFAAQRIRDDAHKNSPARFSRASPVAKKFAVDAAEKLLLSARGFVRLMRVSRTIADLAACEILQPEHVAEALQYRSEN